jgi:hypothetical protein
VILLFVNRKSYHFKTAQHLQRAGISARQVKKRRNPLWIASIFDAALRE